MKALSRLGPLRAVRRSSALQLALRLSGVFTIAILLAGAVSFTVLTEELRSRLGDQAQQLADGLADTLRSDGPAALTTHIRGYINAVDDHYTVYLFLGPDGHSLAGNIDIPKPFTGRRVMQAGRDFDLHAAESDEVGHSYVVYGMRVGPDMIFAGRDMVWISDTREVLLQSLAWGLVAALALSLGLVWTLVRRDERRIGHLNAVLDTVASGDLTRRASDLGQDDIGRIAGSLNATLDRLELSVEGLRQVSNDVAHDLRTPLTRLRNRLEPLLRRADLPADAEAEVARAVTEAEKIVAAFNAVLRIAQIEGGSARAQVAPLDLGALAADVFEMLEPVAEEAGHRMRLDAPAGIAVRGDRDMLGQALTNMAENAIRYCPAPATITVAVSAGDGAAVLSVCDDGPGIPEADRARVLRRFVRLDAARGGEGSGLGLSLVAAVAGLHGGRLKLAVNPASQSGREGLCVSIILVRDALGHAEPHGASKRDG